MSEECVLETEGLTKEFAGFTAVKDVSLQVMRGSIHALIGPNGAGKTTCFNLLTKFLEPTRGTGSASRARDITAMKPADVARLGLVRSFQISAVFPHLTGARERPRRPAARTRQFASTSGASKKVLDVFDDRARATCWTTSA